jgi:hypothetical protein
MLQDQLREPLYVYVQDITMKSKSIHGGANEPRKYTQASPCRVLVNISLFGEWKCAEEHDEDFAQMRAHLKK